MNMQPQKLAMRQLARLLATETGLSEQACRGRLRRYGTKATFVLQGYQTGCCAICGKGGKLSIDHNHANGEVRGLLCAACNSGLGQFTDSVVLLERAINYLKNPPAMAVRPGPSLKELISSMKTKAAQEMGR